MHASSIWAQVRIEHPQLLLRRGYYMALDPHERMAAELRVVAIDKLVVEIGAGLDSAQDVFEPETLTQRAKLTREAVGLHVLLDDD